MDSFEPLELAPGLVEALAAEGIERPTALQQAAIPVVRRGNHLVARAGPGAGVLVAYGAGLLDRLPPGASGAPSALVVTPTAEAARRLAESLARLGQVTGHTVAALGSPWALPERADLLFGTSADLLDAIQTSRLKLDGVQALVVDGAEQIRSLGALDVAVTLLEFIPREAQRVLVSLPLTAAVESFAESHLHRAVRVPPDSGPGGGPGEVARGGVRYVVATEEKGDELLATVAELLEDETRHVLVHVRSEDRAADIGDFLTLHGYAAGAPGDGTAPVWLAVSDMEGRDAAGTAGSGVAVVSHDVPPDADSLDRRHGGGRGGVVLVLARELPHLRDVCRRAGYTPSPARAPAPPRLAAGLARLRSRLAGALERDDLPGYLLMIEPLLERHHSAEVAAAAVALLLERPERPGAGAGAVLETPSRPVPGTVRSWVRIFLSVGEKDGVGPGDLLGAVAGEAGIDGSRVGKIEIRDTFSLVDVDRGDAEKVIRALNGTTIRGRSVRADYDRARGKAPRGRGERGGHRGRGPSSTGSGPGAR